MIIRRIPMNALQKGVFSVLAQYQTTPVYDDVPSNAKLPYITFGSFTCKPTGNKTADIYDVSLQIHIWSEYEGKKEVNEIADDVTAVLTSWPIDLSTENFNIMSQDVDFFEAFPEETAGYHGVITFIAKIQNLGGK
jgi:hypothetical protein